MGTDSAITSNSTATIPNHNKLYLVCVLSVFWFLGLLGMAVWTTNISVLNPRQIERATLIVTGTPTDVVTGRVSVESVWKGTGKTESILIENLNRTTAQNGERWIFPLVDSSRVDGNYAIAPYSESTGVQDPNRPQGLLIYPASPEMEQQLKSLVDSESK